MQSITRNVRVVRAVGGLLWLALLAGCGGGGPEGNAYVDYDGTTLVVEGTPYQREATLDPPGLDLPGRVVVQPEHGKDDEALALVARYGLTLEGRSAEGWLLVKGPPGFEMQWASAIQQQLGGRSFATTDSASAPTAIVLAAETTPAAGEPVPAEEPSAADVRRALFDQYARLEEAGGMSATMTATGQSLLIRAKLFDATKRSCRQLPSAKPGEWECEADTMMGLCNGDCDPADEEPLPHAERVYLRWDPAQGRYVLDA